MRQHLGRSFGWPTLFFGIGLVFCALSFMGLTVSSSITQVRAEESPQASTSPEEAARSFYKWYLQALYESPKADPFREHKSEVEKYVTTRLLQKLANSRRTSTVRKGPDVETEYFFQTLDLNSEWAKNITVSAPTMKGATAVVRVSLSGTDPESKRLEIERDLKVLLRQESGLWKIDDVGVWRQ
jgi:hypothetical protein